MKTNIYHDTRGKSPLEAAPVKISINHRHKTAYVPTNVSVPAIHWDADAHSVKSANKECHRLNTIIGARKHEVDMIIGNLQSRFVLRGMTAVEIRDAVMEILDPPPAEETAGTFLQAYDAYMHMKRNGNTLKRYISTRNKIMEFDSHADELDFEDITHGWLTRFDAFLATTAPTANGRSPHMRNIRTVFNYAINDERTNHYPFRRFKIASEPTIKRSMSITHLRRFWAYTSPHRSQQKLLDTAKLIFLLMGINLIDLYHLQNVSGEFIQYKRSKSGQVVTCAILPEMLPLFASLKGERAMFYYADVYKDVGVFTTSFNRAMREACKELHIPQFSSYALRHTWATIAARLDIPKETIGACLGHARRSVTDIYIDFDNKKIAEANRKVIEYLFSGKE